MSVNIWAWRADDGIHVGLSENAAQEVLDLTVAFGARSGEELWQEVLRQGTDGLRALLGRGGERIDLRGKELVFPFAVSEIWAAGVTYERSRDARREESQGFDAIYLKVYDAERPELFYKLNGRRMAQPGETMGLRPDAHWHVPEPELTVLLGPDGEIFGYTCGNDLSARDVEAANPLYLPQAKIFHKSASLGPSVALAETVDPAALNIALTIRREGEEVFRGEVSTRRMRRTPRELVHYLGLAWPLEPWTALMTGTGIVPPDDFALQDGDEMIIHIDGIGSLVNDVRVIAPDWVGVAR